MATLIFDFDGVIFDTIDETLFISFNVYKGRLPSSFILFEKIPDVFRIRFKRFRYLVTNPFQFSFLCHAIENFPEGEIESSFCKLLKEKRESDNSFEDIFFAFREELMKRHLDSWLALCKPYLSVVNSIKELKHRYRIYISSNRDTSSIHFLFKSVGLRIKPEYILGKEQGAEKVSHIKVVSRREKCRFEDIIFIDDNLINFEGISDLGVCCYLATWGYNHPEQTVAHIKFSYTPISQDAISSVLG